MEKSMMLYYLLALGGGLNFVNDITFSRVFSNFFFSIRVEEKDNFFGCAFELTASELLIVCNSGSSEELKVTFSVDVFNFLVISAE